MFALQMTREIQDQDTMAILAILALLAFLEQRSKYVDIHLHKMILLRLQLLDSDVAHQ